MKQSSILYTLCVFLCVVTLKAQQTPAAPQQEAHLITGATLHLGNGEIIENGAVGFDNGKITYVGTASGAVASEYPTVINASGKHVYPGFILVNSTLGLVEIDAVRATDDIDEVGDMLPHIRSLIAYNAESNLVESMRPNGVLMAQITPRGGVIAGTSSVVHLDAWNWEDAVIKTDGAIHMEWPQSFRRGRWWMGEDPAMKPNENYSKDIDAIKAFLTAAKAYNAKPADTKHLPYAAAKGLFDGSQKLFVDVNGKREIEDAVQVLSEAGVQHLVIVGGEQADQVATMLASKKIPVVVSRPHRLPSSEDINVKHPYLLAGKLSKAGVLTGIDISGQMERMNSRNLPFFAGTAAAYGMDKEDAVALITGNAAKILGIEDIAGTLAVGKDATLFISEGDALDMRTNLISKAFIQGRDISLETKHTELWKRYAKKFGQPTE